MTKTLMLPREVELARSDDAFTMKLGLRWMDGPPGGYVDEPSLDDEELDAWRATFDELCFIAETDQGEALALWRYEPDVDLAHAPVVGLDSEGQLECRGVSFADALVVVEPDPEAVIAFYRGHDIDVAPTREMAEARCRFVPHPNDRHEQRLERAPRTTRTSDPSTVEDLLGMNARDPRVARTLASIERADRPLQLWTDGAGRLTVLYIERDRLAADVRVRAIALGDPVDALEALGEPGRRTSRWATWDREGVRMHVELRDERVSRITLSAIDALPEHLR